MRIIYEASDKKGEIYILAHIQQQQQQPVLPCTLCSVSIINFTVLQHYTHMNKLQLTFYHCPYFYGRLTVWPVLKCLIRARLYRVDDDDHIVEYL